MTVSNNVVRVQTFNGSGSTGPFTFNWRVLAVTDITVTKVDADGTRHTLTNPTDYSASLVALGQSGATITLVSALASGKTLVIEGATPVGQPTAYRDQGRFFPEVHETSYDRLTLVAQELANKVLRSIKLPPETQLDLSLPTPVAGKVLGWNGAATAIVNLDTSSSADAIAAAASAASAASHDTSAAAHDTSAAVHDAAAAASAASINIPSLTGNARKHLQVKADETGHEFVSMNDFMAVFIEGSADNTTYDIALDVPFKVTIYEVYSKCTSGTATATTKIGGVAVTGTPNAISSSEQAQTISAANTVNVGDDVTVTLSAVSACVGARIVVKYRRAT